MPCKASKGGRFCCAAYPRISGCAAVGRCALGEQNRFHEPSPALSRIYVSPLLRSRSALHKYTRYGGRPFLSATRAAGYILNVFFRRLRYPPPPPTKKKRRPNQPNHIQAKPSEAPLRATDQGKTLRSASRVWVERKKHAAVLSRPVKPIDIDKPLCECSVLSLPFLIYDTARERDGWIPAAGPIKTAQRAVTYITFYV